MVLKQDLELLKLQLSDLKKERDQLKKEVEQIEQQTREEISRFSRVASLINSSLDIDKINANNAYKDKLRTIEILARIEANKK